MAYQTLAFAHCLLPVVYCLLISGWRPAVVMRRTDEAYAGEKENSTEYAVNNQALDLPGRAAGIHKDNGEIDQPGNAKQGKDDAKYTFDVHTIALSGVLQKPCQHESRMTGPLR
jgi:hypothetical protein